jgi:hypothetical protein
MREESEQDIIGQQLFLAIEEAIFVGRRST